MMRCAGVFISRMCFTAAGLVTPSQTVFLSFCKSAKEYTEGSVFKRYQLIAPPLLSCRQSQRLRRPVGSRGGNELIAAIRKSALEERLDAHRAALHVPRAVGKLRAHQELNAASENWIGNGDRAALAQR